jgi:hypothetical protein
MVGVFIGSSLAWLVECCYIAVIYFTGLWVPKSIRGWVLGRAITPTSAGDEVPNLTES